MYALNHLKLKLFDQLLVSYSQFKEQNKTSN